MQGTQGPVRKDLVLVGGGHSHVAVLKRFGMRPMEGVRLTLIARDPHTPYSGMLPGYLAGHYTYDEAHVDLRPLAQFAGARLYHDEMVGLDPVSRRVLCRHRPPVPYDLVSIDIGSQPSRVGIPGAERVLPVKPVDRFLDGWKKIAERALEAGSGFRIAVVGGGAGGVELSLSLQHRLRQEGGSATFVLVTDTPEILPTHNPTVRRRFMRILKTRGIAVHAGRRVVAVEDGALHFEQGTTLPCDAVIWVTQASAPGWLAQTGLALTERGFIEVNDCLQSTSHPEVYAAGDVATIRSHPREKSGVIAVRSGPPLASNLRRALEGRRLKRFAPQKQFLALISTGDRYAVASRNHWSLEGAWVWRWKEWIDRRWMRGYQELPAKMAGAEPERAPSSANEALPAISTLAMRCGGCGSKVGSAILTRVLARLPGKGREDILIGLDAPDDAAVVEVPRGLVMVHTVDFFRALVDDAYTFGAIAANHSLSDVYAMGARAQSALAIATLPLAPEAKMEQQLYELLAGALTALDEGGAALVGGHTTEGAELAFGLAVNGLADPARLLRKSGMRPGEKLILTKPLGTGTLFAADMRGKAKGRWVEAAIAMMLQSNRRAAECLREHGARACTDVTGFGLLGHLLEMTKASQVDAELVLDALPVLAGARDTLGAGITSTLAPENVRLRRAIRNLDAAARHPVYPLLFDPQTSGGLLASIPAERADTCAQALRQIGYREAAIIGTVQATDESPEPIRLLL